MSATNGPPKEGDLYKTIKIDRFTFELRFGYYADYERKTGEPVVVLWGPSPGLRSWVWKWLLPFGPDLVWTAMIRPVP